MSRETTVPFSLFSGALLVAVSTVGCGMFNRAPDPIAPLPAAAQEPASAEAPTTANAPAPEPFSLKEGEQLVAHQVAKGDSLWELAQKYDTRVSRIKAANNLQSDMIVEGRTLQIPTKMTAGAPMAAPAATPAAPAPTAPAPAPAPAPTTPAPASPGLVVPPATQAPPSAPAPTAPATPAPAPAAPSQPSLNFGTPPTSGGGSGLKIQD